MAPRRPSVATMEGRFTNGNAKPRKSNFDGQYFCQFTPKDREWWNLKRRYRQHFPALSSRTLFRKPRRSVSGLHKNQILPDQKSRRESVMERLRRVGRKVEDVWTSGILLRHNVNLRRHPHPKVEIYRCAAKIDREWDDSSSAAVMERLVASIPRMMELRMLIQYYNSESWMPRKSPDPSRPASRKDSAVSVRMDMGTTTSSRGPVPAFPFENRPLPHQGVERLLTELHKARKASVKETVQDGGLVGTRAIYRKPSVEIAMETTAAALGISVMDIIGELDFYSYCLGGRNMNQINGVELLKPQDFPAEWRRTLRRDLNLLDGSKRNAYYLHQGGLGSPQEGLGNGVGLRFDGRRRKLIQEMIRMEKVKLLEWSVDHGPRFGIHIVDGAEDGGPVPKNGPQMLGALQPLLSRCASLPRSISKFMQRLNSSRSSSPGISGAAFAGPSGRRIRPGSV